MLGVEPDAPTPVVRDAYRRAARAHHPDRAGDRASARMAEINRAWATLSDPVRRRDYDRSLSVTPTAERSAAMPPGTPVEPKWNPLARYQNPPRFPWGLMAVMAVLGTIAVVVDNATEPEPPPATIDNLLAVGDCVAIEPNLVAVERRCTDEHDGVVVEFLVTDGVCPVGSDPHRDQQGLGLACIERG